jgi:hypothetical protein
VGDLIDVVQEQGEEALADLLRDLGLGGSLADTLASIASSQGRQGVQDILGSSGSGSVPPGVPSSPVQDGPDAGIMYAGKNFSGRSEVLKPGLYVDLPSRGLHDEIDSLKVEPGFEVTLYKHVDSGNPQPPTETIVGPADVENFHVSMPGMADATSGIAVRPIPDGSGTGPTNGNGGGNGTPGNGGSDRMTIGTTEVLLAVLVLALVWQS